MNHFARLHALGYTRLVPIIPPTATISPNSTLFKRVGTPQDGRGKTPGRINQSGTWGSYDWTTYENDEVDLSRWSDMGAGTGVKTGAGLVAIDADTLDTALATIIRDIVDGALGRLPVRVGRNPKALYLCRVSGPLQYMLLTFGNERVEVLTEGKQFVAEGIHPVTGQPYSWPRPLVPFDELPVFTPEQIVAVMEALRAALPAASPVIVEGGGSEVAQTSLAAPLEAVRKAVRATPNTSNHFPTRESYRDYGYAIKAALPDDPDAALELFHEWCDRWTGPHGETNDPDVVDADWRRMRPPFRRGASWLFDLAEERGEFSRVELWHEPVLDVAVPLFEIPDDEPKALLRLIELTSLQDAAASALTASTKPLVKGLLDQGTLSVMYGPSNVGKTFVAMDIAFHIAAGLKWDGLKVSRGTVLYVAAEGGAGARKRSDALMRRYRAEGPGADFQLVLASLNLLDPKADLEPLIATIAAMGRPVSLVVLDTLSRVMAGGEENGSVDMTTMVMHFDKIRKATGAHVMVVHHSGKDQAKGSRGHSSLRAATDTEIEIAEGQIAVTKQRDLDRAFSTAFRLNVVTLGADEDGEPITSCTVDVVRQHVEPTSPATPTEQIVFDALGVLISTCDQPARGVKLVDISSFLTEQQSGMSMDTVRAHLKNLAKKHMVKSPVRGSWASYEPQEIGISASSYSYFEPVLDAPANDQVEENGRETGRSIFD